MMDTEKRELAQLCRDWRDSENLTAKAAAEILGIPRRTYEGIEQGRGFAYPVLLTRTIQSLTPLPSL